MQHLISNCKEVDVEDEVSIGSSVEFTAWSNFDFVAPRCTSAIDETGWSSIVTASGGYGSIGEIAAA